MTIRAGLEVGEPHLFAAQARAVLAAGEFDFVLGSAHYADGMQVAWKEPYFEQPLRQAYAAYFRQVVRLAARGISTCWATSTWSSATPASLAIAYDGPEPYADMIRAALRSLVERGKGLELNTSPLRMGQPEPCPSLQVLRWYRELGGEILTFGSDAHQPEAIGSCFDAALEIARAAGFTRLATFEKRQARPGQQSDCTETNFGVEYGTEVHYGKGTSYR